MARLIGVSDSRERGGVLLRGGEVVGSLELSMASARQNNYFSFYAIIASDPEVAVFRIRKL
jgi:hypothetical protein